MGSKRSATLSFFVGCILGLFSRPVHADPMMLRCDSPKDALSFSVLIDPAKHQVLNIGFGNKIQTVQFSDTVIAAADKDSTVAQDLIIDRVTGQFQLSWAPSSTGDRGGSYQGNCTLARRLF
jgi:hypothetical protein